MKMQHPYRSMIFLITSLMLFPGVRSQTFNSVKGTGPAIDKNINVSDFKGIDVTSGIDVILVQGNSESLTLTAQENLFEYIKAGVENGTLKIYTRNNLRPTEAIKARITFKDITNLKVSGGGDTHSETPLNVETLDLSISGGGDFRSVINSNELKCNINGGGDAKIDGKIKNYSITVSGGGDLESKISAGTILCTINGGGDLILKNETMASKAEIDMNGGGDVDMRTNAEKIICSVSGGGDALISGQASQFEINIDGGGDADAKNLSTEITTFNVGGGSDIHVNASKELSGRISGGGDLYYSGNPAKVSVDARGGSEVHKE